MQNVKIKSPKGKIEFTYSDNETLPLVTTVINAVALVYNITQILCKIDQGMLLDENDIPRNHNSIIDSGSYRLVVIGS